MDTIQEAVDFYYGNHGRADKVDRVRLLQARDVVASIFSYIPGDGPAYDRLCELHQLLTVVADAIEERA